MNLQKLQKLKSSTDSIDAEVKEINDTLFQYSSDESMKAFWDESFDLQGKSVAWYKKRLVELRMIKLNLLQKHNDNNE